MNTWSMGSQGVPQNTGYLRPNYGANIVNNNPTNNIIWVQGIEGAKAWQLNPSSMAILLDSEIEGRMYIKVSDNIGMSTLRTFSFVEELPTQQNNISNNNGSVDLSSYVKKDELETLIKEFLNEYAISTTVSTIEQPSAAIPTTADNKGRTFTPA